MSVLVVGSIALDSVKTPSSSRKGILGGSATFFSMAASFFTKVHVLAVIGEDLEDSRLKVLKDRKVDCSGIVRRKGKSFSWEGEYGSNFNVAITKRTSLNVFRQFDPIVPGRYGRIRNLFLANIDPDIQMKVLDQMKNPRLVVCDTMNFWIENKRNSLTKMISRIGIMLMNDAEIRQYTGESTLLKAAKTLLKLGPRTVVVKRGEFGAVMFHGNGIFALPAYPLEDIIDPTGAGDSFAGGFVGYLSGKRVIDEGVLRRAVVAGSVMASFAVQSFSIDSFRALTFKKIVERYRRFKAFTSFGMP